MRLIKIGILILFCAFRAGAGHAETALIAVATNFSDAAADLADVFQSVSVHEVQISVGSSGSLFALVNNGAPFDVFLAADQQYPHALTTIGLGVAGTEFTYARGRLVLFASSPNLRGVDAASVLLNGQYDRLAIANPALAPYGRAAQQVLQNLDLWASMQHKLVTGQNVGQAYAMVASGNAPLGIIAESALHGDHADAGRHWPIPADLYQPIRQNAVLLEHGRTNAAALAFMDFLRSAEALEIIAYYGYGVER